MGHTSAPVRNSYEALQSIPPQKMKLNTCTLEFNVGLWRCKPAVLCVRVHVQVTVEHAGLSRDCCTHQEKRYCWKGQSELYLPRRGESPAHQMKQGDDVDLTLKDHNIAAFVIGRSADTPAQSANVCFQHISLWTLTGSYSVYFFLTCPRLSDAQCLCPQPCVHTYRICAALPFKKKKERKKRK